MESCEKDVINSAAKKAPKVTEPKSPKAAKPEAPRSFAWPLKEAKNKNPTAATP
jgi:hypothetical protein